MNDLRKLPEIQRAIIVLASLHADISHSEIAKKLKIRPSTVSTTISKLTEAGIFVRRPVIEYDRLGLRSYHVYLSPDTRRDRTRILSVLKKMDGVTTLIETEGPSSIFLVYVTGHQFGPGILFDRLASEAKCSLGKKRFALIRRGMYFARKYLCPRVDAGHPVALGSEHATHKLSDADIEILKVLTSSSRPSVESVSRSTKISASTVQFRLGRLRQHGIVTNYISQFAMVIPTGNSGRILVRVTGDRIEAQARAFKFAELHPEVMSCWQTVGEWDLEMRFETKDGKMLISLFDLLDEALSPYSAEREMLTYTDVHMLERFPFADMRSLRAHQLPQSS